jgi:hypothetical protein
MESEQLSRLPRVQSVATLMQVVGRVGPLGMLEKRS